MRGRRRRGADGNSSTQTATITTTNTTTTPAERVVTLELRDEPLPTVAADEAKSASAQDTRERRNIRWAEDTVDNELLNRKKSKICCIFHKKRAFGESSSSESEDH